LKAAGHGTCVKKRRAVYEYRSAVKVQTVQRRGAGGNMAERRGGGDGTVRGAQCYRVRVPEVVCAPLLTKVKTGGEAVRGVGW